mmetsp:Transcript_80427/g.253901  ORF Transcript_80427/g.253901 Transcript_80427/m.253901 type:complete len:325 (-) Transcript_80427:91-1065(-)
MAMVQFMTPGLAFFYGGLVRSTNILTIMFQSFLALGVGLLAVFWQLRCRVDRQSAHLRIFQRGPCTQAVRPGSAQYSWDVVRGLPGHVCSHLAGAHDGGLCGSRAHWPVPDPARGVDAPGLRAGLPLGLGRRLDAAVGHHGLCGRHRRPHHLRVLRARRAVRHRPSDLVRGGLRGDSAAQRPVRRARDGDAVLRLVRLQRRLRGREQRGRRGRRGELAAGRLRRARPLAGPRRRQRQEARPRLRVRGRRRGPGHRDALRRVRSALGRLHPGPGGSGGVLQLRPPHPEAPLGRRPGRLGSARDGRLCGVRPVGCAGAGRSEPRCG